MKILFICFSSLPDYHFYTDLELILDSVENKHDVTILHCGGVLESCFFHNVKTLANCYHCKTKFINNVEELNKKNKIVNIEFLEDNIKLPLDIKYDFDSIKELKEYKIDNIDFGMAVASSLISTLREHNIDTRKNARLIKIYLKSSLKIYFATKNYLEKNRPDLVYIFNGRFSETRPIIRICKNMGINFYTHERGGSLNKYELFENTLPHDFDYITDEINKYWNRNDINKEKIANEWLEKRMGAIDTSWYSFIKDQEKGSLPTNFESNKENISIFNSSEDEFAAIDEKIKMPIYDSQFEAIKKIVEHFKDNKDIHFYLRVHPNLKNLKNTQTREINELKEYNFSNLTIISSNDKVDTYKLISLSSKIITFGSTVGIEAVLLNKPSIMIGNALYEKLDCTYNPQNEKDLFDLILNFELPSKSRDNALKYAYWEATHGYNFKYFEPTDFAGGLFMGKNIDLYTYQVLIRKFLSLLHKLNPYKIKINKS